MIDELTLLPSFFFFSCFVCLFCPQVYLCRSGSAAHTQAVAGYANLYLNQHAVELGQKGCSVKIAGGAAEAAEEAVEGAGGGSVNEEDAFELVAVEDAADGAL